MSSKISLTAVVTEHYKTLYDHAHGKPSFVDFALLLGLPVVAGVAAWRGDILVVAAGQVLAGVSIIGGFLFGLLTFVFQLRINATSDPRIPQGGSMATLLDEFFYNVAYTTLIAFTTAGLVLVPMSLGSSAPAQEGVLDVGWSVAVIVLLVHFGLNLAMCIKRAQGAYAFYARR